VSQDPASIGLSTNFITVVAQVQNFDFMPGCTVNIHMAMTKRID
jgi:hypothetical protein